MAMDVTMTPKNGPAAKGAAGMTLNHQEEPAAQQEPAAYVLWFESLSRGDTPVAGGKGANLGELTKAGYIEG
jgi:pyruvate,water dikinase